MKSKKTGQVVFAIFIALSILFIWSNSFKNGNSSMGESNYFKDLIISFFRSFNIDVDGTFFIDQIRKFGHFSEYLILGCELISYCRIFHEHKRQNYLNFFYIGVLTAFFDETIQLIPSLGRSSEVKDVWIDIVGIICGFVIVAFVIKVKKIINNKKK